MALVRNAVKAVVNHTNYSIFLLYPSHFTTQFPFSGRYAQPLQLAPCHSLIAKVVDYQHLLSWQSHVIFDVLIYHKLLTYIFRIL